MFYDSILELGGKEFTVMLYKVKKTFPVTMVLEEYDTGKEVTVQLLNGTSVHDVTNDALALIKGIISNEYSIVCYNNGDYLMQDMKTNKQIYLSEVIKETTPITEDGYVLLYDWVTKR